MAALCLLEVLAQVPDPRSPRRRVHPLPAVLPSSPARRPRTGCGFPRPAARPLTVRAVPRGRTASAAIAQFGRDHGAPLAHALGFRRGKTPAASCLSELFRRLDPVAFEAA